MKRKRIPTICLLAALLLPFGLFFTGCSEEPLWEPADAATIDTSLYEPSGVCYSMGQLDFVDAPGMLIYRVQGIQTATGNTLASRMAFINKATGTSHLFCFDPLCDHNSENCIAAVFNYVSGNVAYNAVSDMLYCILPSPEYGGSGGSTLYKVDMLASGATLVWEGDRNEIGHIAAAGKYVFWTHNLPKGGRELCRLNVETEVVDTYPMEEGKNISSFYVSGDCIYLTFMNEIEYYLTDPEFTETRKLEHFYVGMSWHYLRGHTAYRMVRELDESEYPLLVYATYYCSAFMAYDILTGEETPLLEGDDAFWISGISDDAIYYFTYSDIPHLYRLKTDGSGEKELFYSFDYTTQAGLPEDYWPFNFRSIWAVNGMFVGKTEVYAGPNPFGVGYRVTDSYFSLITKDETGNYTSKRIDTYA